MKRQDSAEDALSVDVQWLDQAMLDLRPRGDTTAIVDGEVGQRRRQSSARQHSRGPRSFKPPVFDCLDLTVTT
jgi:hypothetical protein